MKKLIIRWGAFFILFFGILFIMLRTYPDEYYESYQRVLWRQYDYLQSKADDNKAIFIGSSTLSFGLDMDTMENLLGEPVVILGNHTGYGVPFLVEMSKSALKEGDIVVIELADQSMTEGAPLLILTGLGHRLRMYRFFVPQLWRDALLTIPVMIRKNVNAAIDGGQRFDGVYSIYSYDERGNMIIERQNCVLSDPYAGESGWGYFEPIPLNEGFVRYLNRYVDYCEKRGVDVYFTLQHSFIEQLQCTTEQMDERDAIWASQLDAPLVSHSRDYAFPREYIFDGHCNTPGQIHRTELLYNDLKPYL